MTAEIAVLNRNGVALAADSAVTVDSHTGQKIYNTVNKVFTLSKVAPVGIMIYGTAQITGVPWEIVIKEFRRAQGDTRYAYLEEYSRAFINFLETHTSLFTDAQQRIEVHTHSHGLFQQILRDTTEDLHSQFAANEAVTESEVRNIASRHIREMAVAIGREVDVPSLPTDYCKSLHAAFDDEINDAIDCVFQRIPLSPRNRRDLRDLLCVFMTKEAFPSISSGIVFAGYGEDEHFPGVHAFDIQSVLLGKAKSRDNTNFHVAGEVPGGILPFAQREMVDLFMRGLAPSFRQAIEVAIEEFLKGLPDALLGSIALPQPQKSRLKRKMTAAGNAIYSGFDQALSEFSERNYVDPILEAVAVLPKEGLAEMAESLVNLTSFKRRVTMDPETVGGPIDVAVISKGDGFIWIKRKHYFEPELNHNFFANYFK